MEARQTKPPSPLLPPLELEAVAEVPLELVAEPPEEVLDVAEVLVAVDPVTGLPLEPEAPDALEVLVEEAGEHAVPSHTRPTSMPTLNKSPSGSRRPKRPTARVLTLTECLGEEGALSFQWLPILATYEAELKAQCEGAIQASVCLPKLPRRRRSWFNPSRSQRIA